MLLQLFVDIIFGFLDFTISLIPPLPVWNNIATAISSLDWAWKTFSNGFLALGYIAGDNFLVALPLLINIFLIPVEFTISILWLILHRSHIAGSD